MNARTARMIQEGSVREGTLGATIIIAFILVVVALAMPGQHASPAQKGSLIAAHAGVLQVAHMPPPAADATEGNVSDLTY